MKPSKKMKNKISAIVVVLLISLIMPISNALTIEEVSSSPQEMSPGESSRIRIMMENNFEEDLENVQTSLDFSEVPFAPDRSSTDRYIGEMDEGDDERANFRIVALPDSQPGIYKIPVIISYNYENENKTRTKESTIALTINSEPELRTSVQESFLVKGQSGEITVRVTNSGLSNARFVSLDIGNHNSINFLDNKEAYMGDIESDDFDTETFSVEVKENAPNPINIPVTISYSDPTNEDHTDTEQLTLRSYTEKQAVERGIIERPNYTLPIIIGLAIIGFIVYRKVKKRKKKS